MRFAINTEPRDRQHPVVLLLSMEEYRRMACEAEYLNSLGRCPTLAALVDAKVEFDASLGGSAPEYHPPLVRTGQGDYQRDYTPGLSKPADHFAEPAPFGPSGCQLDVTA